MVRYMLTLVRSRPRRFAAGLVVLGALTTLVACGGDDDSSTTAAGDNAAPTTTAASSDTEPAPGSTGAPAAAGAGVAVLDEIAALTVLSLGVIPASIDATFGYSSVADIARSLDVTVNPGARSVEDVIAARPTAVIGVSIPTFVEAADTYAEVADAVVVVDFSASWEEQADQVAAALGIEEQATALKASTQATIDALRADIEAAGKTGTTVSVLLGGTEGPGAMSSTGLVGELLDELGLERPAAQDVETSATEPFLSFSDELLLDHDADVVLVLSGPSYPSEIYTQAALWNQMSAVQTGNAHEVFGEVWFAASAFSVDWILADIRAAVLGEGDVATGDQAVERWEQFAGS